MSTRLSALCGLIAPGNLPPRGPVTTYQSEPDLPVEQPLPIESVIEPVIEPVTETAAIEPAAIPEMLTRLMDFEKEMAEFRKVHVSRRGVSGPRGETGSRGIQGIPGQGIVGPKGDRGEQGLPSTVPGPQGIQGLPGCVVEATDAAKTFVEDAILSLKKDLPKIILEALQKAGALDAAGNAVLIPGPRGLTGATGAAGHGGRDGV